MKKSMQFSVSAILLLFVFFNSSKSIGSTSNKKPSDQEIQFHFAIRDGDIEKVRTLIANGVDVNARDNYGNTPMTRLIDILFMEPQNEHVEILKLLVANGANVREKGDFDATALHWAASEAHKDLAELLIAKGTEINARDMEDQTPLHMASFEGNLDIAKLLIAKGADINSQDNFRRTPLHRAAFFGHKDIVKLLVAKGADITMKDYSGCSPIHDAAWQDHTDIVEFLIASGADIHPLDNYRKTPLHLAAEYYQKDTIEFLIGKGANVNAKNIYGASPLGLAVGGHRKIAELPKANDSDGYCKRGDYFYRKNEFIRSIEDYSSAIRLNPENDRAYYLRGRAWAKKDEPRQAVADWKRAIELNWNNILHIYYSHRLLKIPDKELNHLIQETAMEHLEDLEVVSGYAVGYSGSPGAFYIVSLVISSPFEEEIFLQMARHRNPVTRALAMICLARKDLTKYVKILSSFYTDRAEIQYMPLGCIVERITLDKLVRNIIEDPNVLDCWSAARTDWISTRSSERDAERKDTVQRQVGVIQALISKGADINAKDKLGETLLHYAAEHGSRRIAEFLIANGANINAANEKGETPLHCSTFWGYRQMVELLMANGADITAETNEGQTALDIAVQQDYPGLSALLREFEQKK